MSYLTPPYVLWSDVKRVQTEEWTHDVPLTADDYLHSMIRFAEPYRVTDRRYLLRLGNLWAELSEDRTNPIWKAYLAAAAQIGQWIATDDVEHAPAAAPDEQGGAIGSAKHGG